MSGMSDLVKIMASKNLVPEIAYLPHSISDIKIIYGVPPVPIIGLNYIWAKHNVPQVKLFKCLTSSGVFGSNLNTSGIIEIGILDGSLSCGGIQIMGLTGIPFPIIVTDLNSGGTSTVVATACRQAGTPEWRKEAFVGVQIFTFETPRLLISQGIKLPMPQ